MEKIKYYSFVKDGCTSSLYSGHCTPEEYEQWKAGESNKFFDTFEKSKQGLIDYLNWEISDLQSTLEEIQSQTESKINL